MRLPLRLTIALIWLFAFIQTSSAFSHEQAGRLRTGIFVNGVDTSFTTNKLTQQAAKSFIYEPGIDRPLASIDGNSGVATYYHQDALGSIIGLTDSAGVLIEEYRYDAWGAVTVVQAGVVQPVTTVPQSRFLFTGREYDAVSGLYHYRARAYSTKLGRFLQLDPIDFDGGDLNIYRYVSNDPINLWDPLGLCPEIIPPELLEGSDGSVLGNVLAIYFNTFKFMEEYGLSSGAVAKFDKFGKLTNSTKNLQTLKKTQQAIRSGKDTKRIIDSTQKSEDAVKNIFRRIKGDPQDLDDL